MTTELNRLEAQIQNAQDHLEVVDDDLPEAHKDNLEVVEEDLEAVEDLVDDAQDHTDPTLLRDASARVDDAQGAINDIQEQVGYDDADIAAALEALEDAVETVEDSLDEAITEVGGDDGSEALTLTVSGETKDAPEPSMTPKKILRLFEYDLDDYYLYPVDDVDTTEEPLPGDTEINLHDRNEFAAVAVDVGYGATAAENDATDLDLENEVLEAHIEELREDHEVEINDDVEPQFTHVVVKDWSIPSTNYNKDSTDVMIRAPQEYPEKAPDWVYVDEDLRREDGGQLRSSRTNQVEGWLALSWHISKLNGVEWRPYETGLKWYLETVVRGRLVQGD